MLISSNLSTILVLHHAEKEENKTLNLRTKTQLRPIMFFL